MRHKSDPFAKPFAWSYSKLKNYETCPKRHYHCDLVRDVPEEESEALRWGNMLHDALASAIGTDDNHLRPPRERITYKPLPADLARYQPWVARISGARSAGGHVYAEQSLAITRDFLPCEWFDRAAWFRTKIDASVFTPDQRAAAAYDWKTGKRTEDSPQLFLSSVAMMAHNPSLDAVRAEFVWLKDMRDEAPFDCVDRVAFRRRDIPHEWSRLVARVKNLEQAFQERAYPPRPGFLCRRWCPVTQCEHHGK